MQSSIGVEPGDLEILAVRVGFEHSTAIHSTYFLFCKSLDEQDSLLWRFHCTKSCTGSAFGERFPFGPIIYHGDMAIEILRNPKPEPV